MLKLYEFPIDITEHIQKFRKFLNISFNYTISNIMDDHDWENDGYFIDDWMQINWEILVERELLGVNYGLTLYGVTYSGESNLHPNRDLDFIVITHLEEPQKDSWDQKDVPLNKPLRFYEFMTISEKDRGCHIAPPFDIACFVDESTKKLYKVPLDKVKLMLYPINPNFMTAKKDISCRVCGFEKLEIPEGEEGRKRYYHFCRCCGVEFRSEDCSLNIVRAHRMDWLEQGSPWYREDEMPDNWSAKEQLKMIPERYL